MARRPSWYARRRSTMVLAITRVRATTTARRDIAAAITMVTATVEAMDAGETKAPIAAVSAR